MMKSQRQILLDPPLSTRGNQGVPNFGWRTKRCSGAQTTSTGVPCRVSAWKILPLRDIDHLPLLSRELDRLGIGVAALF